MEEGGMSPRTACLEDIEIILECKKQWDAKWKPVVLASPEIGVKEN